MAGYVLTLVTEVVSRRGEDLHGTSKVEKVKLGVQCDEHFNGLISHGGGLIRSHLAGIAWCKWVWGGWTLRSDHASQLGGFLGYSMGERTKGRLCQIDEADCGW